MSDRYSRQIILPEVGAAGQGRLRATSVLVIGAGGLGCAVLQYLCAAGVGRLVIVDHDRVEESNLHRQPLYRMSDLGELKTQAARRALLQANPEVTIDALAERLTPANALRLLAAADLVVDAADSFAVTYVLSDACRRASKVLVSASGEPACTADTEVGAHVSVFPEMPRQAGSCAQSGVLGTAVGVMGTLQAHMVLALALELQPTVLGQLITVDFRTLRVGGFSFAQAQEPAGALIAFIAPADVSHADIVIDVRSVAEAPVSPFAAALRIGVEEIERAQTRFPPEPRIVVCCRTGVRAWRAARALHSQGHEHLALIALGE